MYGFGKEIIFWYFYERFADFMGDFVHELGCEVMKMLRKEVVEFSYFLPIFEKLHAVGVA